MIKGFKRKTFYATFFNYKIQNYYDSSRSVILNQKNTYLTQKIPLLPEICFLIPKKSTKIDEEIHFGCLSTKLKHLSFPSE